MSEHAAYIRIINNSSINWTLKSTNLNHGSWDIYPPGSVSKDEDTQGTGGDPTDFTISAKKDYGSYGVSGDITYSSSAGSTFTINFLNKYGLGTNKGSVNNINQGTNEPFAVKWSAGTGNSSDSSWSGYQSHQVPKSGHPLYMKIEIDNVA